MELRKDFPPAVVNYIVNHLVQSFKDTVPYRYFQTDHHTLLIVEQSENRWLGYSLTHQRNAFGTALYVNLKLDDQNEQYVEWRNRKIKLNEFQSVQVEGLLQEQCLLLVRRYKFIQESLNKDLCMYLAAASNLKTEQHRLECTQLIDEFKLYAQNLEQFIHVHN